MPLTRSVFDPIPMRKGKAALKKSSEAMVGRSVVEEHVSPIDSDDEVEVDEELLDVDDADTEAWLRSIKLWEYANLPWADWEQNPKAQEQFDYLKSTGGVLPNQVQMTPDFVAAAF